MIENNQVVLMLFKLQDADTHEVLEDNTKTDPLAFIMGQGSLLDALEHEISKLELGASADILIKKEQALGDYNPELLVSLPRSDFAGLDLHVGMELFGEDESGEQVRVTVKDMDDDSVKIDYNHPYAGRNLLFGVSIIDVRPATQQELEMGIAASQGNCGCGTCDCQ